MRHVLHILVTVSQIFTSTVQNISFVVREGRGVWIHDAFWGEDFDCRFHLFPVVTRRQSIGLKRAQDTNRAPVASTSTTS